MLNKKSSLSSPVSGRSGSISTTLSSVRGDNDLQREEIEDQPQPSKQNPEEKLKKQEMKTQVVKQIQLVMVIRKKEMRVNYSWRSLQKKEQNTQENENLEPTK